MVCGCAKRQSNQEKEAAQLKRHPTIKKKEAACKLLGIILFFKLRNDKRGIK